MKVYLTHNSHVESVETSRKLGAGGEGTVYMVQNDPSLCIKIYHEKHRTAAQEAKLKAMLASPPNDPTVASGHHSICWPTHLVYEDEACSKFLGFAMPRIDTKTFKEYHLLCDKPSATTTTCYRLEHFGTGFTYLHMYVVAMNLASCVASIHSAGHAVGDLNDKNILVSTRDSKITIVDCDSFEIHDKDSTVFPCAVFMPEYSAPEVIRQQSIENRQQSDNFALAILIFKLLMLNTHPFAARGESVDHLHTPGDKILEGLYPYEPHEGKDATPPPYALDYDIIPPDIRLLFRKAFVDGHYTPRERPTAHDWITVLRHHFRTMYDAHNTKQFMCSRNSLHYFPDHLKECPWCAMKEDYFPTTIVKKDKYTTQAQPLQSIFWYIIELLEHYAKDIIIDTKEYKEFQEKIRLRNISDDDAMYALSIFRAKHPNVIIGEKPFVESSSIDFSILTEQDTIATRTIWIQNALLHDWIEIYFNNLPSGVSISTTSTIIPPKKRQEITITLDINKYTTALIGQNRFNISIYYYINGNQIKFLEPLPCGFSITYETILNFIIYNLLKTKFWIFTFSALYFLVLFITIYHFDPKIAIYSIFMPLFQLYMTHYNPKLIDIESMGALIAIYISAGLGAFFGFANSDIPPKEILYFSVFFGAFFSIRRSFSPLNITKPISSFINYFIKMNAIVVVYLIIKLISIFV